MHVRLFVDSIRGEARDSRLADIVGRTRDGTNVVTQVLVGLVSAAVLRVCLCCAADRKPIRVVGARDAVLLGAIHDILHSTMSVLVMTGLLRPPLPALFNTSSSRRAELVSSKTRLMHVIAHVVVGPG